MSRSSKSASASKKGTSYINEITDDTISVFLAQQKSRSIHSWTHENGIIPLGTYDLSDDVVQRDFHTLYSKLMKEKKNEFVVGIRERSQGDWPVIIRVLAGSFTVDQILECVRSAQQALIEVFPESDWSDELADCFVLEPESKTTERSVRVSTALKKTMRFDDDGLDYFILHFPRVFLRQETLELLFYPVVHRELQKVFGLDTNSKHSVIDSELLSQSYPMYGSRKYSHMKPMHISMVVNVDLEKITVAQALQNYQIYDYDQDVLVEQEPDSEEAANLLLPRVLSIHRCHRVLYEINSSTFLGKSTVIEVAKQYVCRQAMIRWFRRNCASEVAKVDNKNLKKDKPKYFNPKQSDAEHANETYDEQWTSIDTDRLKDVDRELRTEGERVGLMDMLGRNRAQKKTQWVELGRILWDLYGGNKRGLDCFVEFTRKYERKPRAERKTAEDDTERKTAEEPNNPVDESDDDEDEPPSPKKPGRSPRPSTPSNKDKHTPEVRCLSLWNRIEPGPAKTMSSLHELCREDSTNAYQEYLAKRKTMLLQSCIVDQSHVKVAKLIQSELGNRFICFNNQKGDWYEFKQHRWHKQSGGAEFNQAALSVVENIINDQLDEWETKIGKLKKESRKINKGNSNDDDRTSISNSILQEIVRLDMQRKMLEKLGSNFGKTGFKASVLKECCNLMFQRGFQNRLNQNIWYLHFTNGVLDLSMGKYRAGMLRAGRPEDYLTKSCGYPYPTHITSIDHPEVVRVMDHLMKIFPRSKLREWFLEFAGGLLVGGNPHKQVVVHNGGGHNGKSVTNDLIRLALGDYYTTIPISFLTGKRADSGSCTPEIADIDGVRYLVMNEPDANECINSGKLKEFSGNDLIMVRGLFSEPRIICPMFKMAIVANMLPNFSVDDPAVWARIRKLNYESRFENNSEINSIPISEQLRDKRFAMDPHFNNYIPQMKLGMIWLMHYYHQKISKDGRSPEPKEIIEATLSYRVENDPVDRFLRDCVVSTTKRATKDKAGNLTSTAEDTSYLLDSSDEFKTMLDEHEIVNLQEDDLFASYTKWFQSQGINSKSRPAKRDFVESLSKFYGSPTKTLKPEVYKGWKFVYIRTNRAFRTNGNPVSAETSQFNGFNSAQSSA